MRRMRLRRVFRARVAQLVVVAVAATAGVFAFGVGSAFASGSYTCTGVAAVDTPGLQALISGGGTVTVFGPLPCVGNWTVPVSVTIVGGSPGATLNGNAADSVLTATAGGITLTLRNLKVTNGAAAVEGGGVDMACCANTLNLQNAVVTGNTAGVDGGGVFIVDGTINDPSSTISNNSAAEAGGGIAAVLFSLVNVTNSTVVGNSSGPDPGFGGGIAVTDASEVVLTGATVSRNSGMAEGGGVYLEFGSTLSATASTISSNSNTGFGIESAGGGISSFLSDVLLQNTKVAGNLTSGFGGGIAYAGDSAGDLKPQTAAGTAAHGFQPHKAWAPALPAGVRPLPALPPVVSPGLEVDSSSVDHNTAQLGAGGGIAVATDCTDTTIPVTLNGSAVSLNRTTGSEFDTDSGGGGYVQYADCTGDTASMVATGSTFVGNLARTSVGGGIFNVSYDGTALVTLASTNVASGPPYINPNQAKFGGGIFNWDTNSNVTLQAGGNIIHNQATVTGGGVFNDCGATLTVAPGAFITMNMPNQVVTNLGPCVVVD